MAKNKNISKMRPIVSYFKHPCRRILRTTARAINFLIKALPTRVFRHFILDRVDDFIPTLTRIVADARANELHSSASLNADIANMYTTLDHTSIKSAIKQLLNLVKCTRRREFLSIPYSKYEPVTFGKTSRANTKRFTMSLHDIYAIVCMDLDNIYFKVGDTIMRQIHGIPMGSPLSPAMAICICAFYENKFLRETEERDMVFNNQGEVRALERA